MAGPRQGHERSRHCRKTGCDRSLVSLGRGGGSASSRGAQVTGAAAHHCGAGLGRFWKLLELSAVEPRGGPLTSPRPSSASPPPGVPSQRPRGRDSEALRCPGRGCRPSRGQAQLRGRAGRGGQGSLPPRPGQHCGPSDPWTGPGAGCPVSGTRASRAGQQCRGGHSPTAPAGRTPVSSGHLHPRDHHAAAECGRRPPSGRGGPSCGSATRRTGPSAGRPRPVPRGERDCPA